MHLNVQPKSHPHERLLNYTLLVTISIYPHNKHFKIFKFQKQLNITNKMTNGTLSTQYKKVKN